MKKSVSIQTGMARMAGMAGAVRKKDLVMAPICEAALIAVAGLAAWWLHQALLFASLGPTAYEMIETPERKSAKPYNVIAGHLIAVLAGLGAVWAMRAGAAPAASMSGVALVRVGAAVIAAGATVLGTLLTRATQPAAVSTTLLLALGAVRGWRGGAAVMVAVLLMVLLGEPLRFWREKERGEAQRTLG